MAYISSQRRETFTLEQILNKLEQLLYLLVIVPLVAFLPARLAYGIACRRGDWAYRHDTITRKRLLRSLEGVIGDQLSYTDRAQVARDFFRRRSCEAIDMMRLAGKGRALARLVEIHGLEHIEAALVAGKGAVLCSAHFGFFNGGFSLIGTCGLPITVVGNQKSSSDPSISSIERFFWRFIIEKRVARHRRRPNIKPEKGQVEAAIQIAEILRSNEVIAMAIDVPAPPADRERAIRVDFLDRPIHLLSGSVSLAQLTGSRVMVLVVRRSANWRHQVLEISPVPLGGDSSDTFKRCVAMVEVPIRQNLASWNTWENPQSLVDLGLLSTYSEIGG